MRTCNNFSILETGRFQGVGVISYKVPQSLPRVPFGLARIAFVHLDDRQPIFFPEKNILGEVQPCSLKKLGKLIDRHLFVYGLGALRISLVLNP